MHNLKRCLTNIDWVSKRIQYHLLKSDNWRRWNVYIAALNWNRFINIHSEFRKQHTFTFPGTSSGNTHNDVNKKYTNKNSWVVYGAKLFFKAFSRFLFEKQVLNNLHNKFFFFRILKVMHLSGSSFSL